MTKTTHDKDQRIHSQKLRDLVSQRALILGPITLSSGKQSEPLFRLPQAHASTPKARSWSAKPSST